MQRSSRPHIQKQIDQERRSARIRHQVKRIRDAAAITGAGLLVYVTLVIFTV